MTEPPEDATVYPVKRGHRAKTELASVMEEAFGSVKQDGDWCESSFELIESVRARYYKKSRLWVINNQRKDLSDMDAAIATRDAWNKFLNNATGYTPKKRRDKLKQWAKEGKL